MTPKFPHRFAQGLLLSGLTVLCGSALIPRTNSQISVAMQPPACPSMPASNLFARTELFFGLSKPDGSEVTEAEFQQFLNREITPRFPDGLTLLAGRGQFKNSQGATIQEQSRLLILLYALPQQNNSSQKIEQIRTAYRKAFQQEWVLRTDGVSCTSF